MRTKAFVGIMGLRGLHHGVDGANHGFAVAPGVVAGQQIATQAIADKHLRGYKHLGFRPAKAVNALLGVTHNKHTRCLACAHVATEPGIQRLPLQRVGVLKLVNHQVAYACVQPLLHPAGQHIVAQHDLCGALHVIHVHPAAFPLQGGEFGQQQAGQPGHALLKVPGIVLLAGFKQAQGHVLRFTHDADTGDFFAELAGCAFFCQQRCQDVGSVAFAQGFFQHCTCGAKRRCRRPAEYAGSIHEQPGHRRVRTEDVVRMAQACKLGKLHAKVLH